MSQPPVPFLWVPLGPGKPVTCPLWVPQAHAVSWPHVSGLQVLLYLKCPPPAIKIPVSSEHHLVSLASFIWWKFPKVTEARAAV